MEIRTLVFDGLLIEGAVVGEKLLPSRIEIESARWRVRGGLGVGATVGEIVRALGNAHRQVGDTLEYGGMTEFVRFTLEQGKVKKIVLIYYTG